MGREQDRRAAMRLERIPQAITRREPEGRVVVIAPQVVQAIFENRVVEGRPAPGFLQPGQATIETVGQGRLAPLGLAGR